MVDIVLCAYGVCFKRADSVCRNCGQQYCELHIQQHTIKGGIVCTCFLTPQQEQEWDEAEQRER